MATAALAVVAAAVPVAAPSLTSVGTPQVAAGSRAMWLWSRAEAAEVVPWAAAHGVTEIFAYVETDVASTPQLARLKEIRKRAGAVGIRLIALNGEPGWVNDPAAAVAWRRAVTATGLFAGLHVDVEPHVLPGWEANRSTIGARYVSMLDKLRTGATLPIEADVAFWYGEVTVTGGRNLATETLKRVDAVTVMSYRDTATGANSMYAVSRDWLARGATAGKKVRLGAETAPLPDCAYCSFAEEGATILGAELARLDVAAARDRAYNGISIQHYASWRALHA
ncbi:hypothetical protein [Catenuloplanes atrovinosus]|uniref:Amidase n=1 Tax=Catenuloplanes atrovinosus TaxID=137266 RepID=A0AAE4C8J3_9ACTN|nr:hypothetical protein [Catenuloplanes atrovinosus]MDR7273854.1 hypothetical protein [Catenuloplanes atrovinosus]